MFQVIEYVTAYKSILTSIKKEYDKLNKILAGIRDMDKLPIALIVAAIMAMALIGLQGLFSGISFNL